MTTDTELYQLVDKMMNKIKNQLDQYDANNDFDFETHGGIMTPIIQNDSNSYQALRNTPSNMISYTVK